ncbi:helicase-exonuclease AddAB subunit AddB [Clostridium sp. JN-1]|uniref:helicase-exonuclease AddAB subunit AddB n=1 Tax=Clostridium sp. JN-1 TaxID=2483110 RepID=UPI000F0B8207|nr:helicase-exonuclease AddAB subunit AddB [Clostridium sp. JN-1]
MSLRFIYGRAGSGKSYYCLNDIKKKIDEGCTNSLILLVPEQFSFQAEKNLINTIGEKGMFKAQVMSFRSMAYKVLSEVGGITLEHVNAAGKNMLIYRIMDENSSNLKTFAKSARRQGFVSMISDIITELKRYDVSPQLLQSTLEEVEDENLKDKIYDISLIFSEFEDRLHKQYIDAEDDLTILAKNLPKSHLFDESEIWVDEFISFTPQEYNVLNKLLLKAKRLNVTVCTNSLNEKGTIEDTDLFLPTKTTETKLLQIANDNNIKYDKPIALNCNPCYRFKKSLEIQHLEKYLFSFPYKKYSGKNSNIGILRALNKYTEIKETAKDIIRICRDKGFRFKDIAVISGDLDGYEALIRAVFSEYNIPFFIDKKRKIFNNPIIVFVISAVEIIAKNWSYESVFKYLKTGFLDISTDEIDIIENYVLSNGISGSKWINEDDWKFNINYSIENKDVSGYEKEMLSKINDIRNRIRRPLLKLSKSIKGKKTARQICEGIYNFLCDIDFVKKIENIMNDFRECGELDRVNEYNQIWNIIIELLDQIVETIGDESFTVSEFYQILAAGFEEYEIGVIPPALDQVLVGSVTRIKSHDVNALYIVGVNDGVFPAPLPDEGMLSDKDRENLNDHGVEISKSTRNRVFEEQFLIYSTLTIVSKYLKLSYVVSDEDGKGKRPSVVISRMKKLFPNLNEQNIVIGRNDDNSNIDSITGPNAVFNELISNIRKHSDGEYMNGLWLDVYRWYKLNDDWNEKLDKVLKGFYYTNEVEINDTSKVRKLYGRHLNMSISRLEKFVQCPFAYFMQYGLKAKERKVYKLTPPDFGSFIHNMLKLFSDKVSEENLSWSNLDEEWCKDQITSIVDETLENVPGSIFNSSKRYKYETNKVKRILITSIWLITKHMKKSDFKPLGYEVDFKNNGKFPPISIELHSGETVTLTGRIDRLDGMSEESETYLRIVDYKSGIKEFKLSDVYYGLQMQLLIYLDAILTEFEKMCDGTCIPGGILYFKLDDPIIKVEPNISDEDIEERIMKALRMNGLILNDPEVVKRMDNSINKSSDVIPVTVKKDGSISNSLSSVATLEQFNILRKYIRDTIAELCEQILEGNINISPCKNKRNTACNYCIYSFICQFDTLMKGNKYRNMKEKSDQEVWNELQNRYDKEE